MTRRLQSSAEQWARGQALMQRDKARDVAASYRQAIHLVEDSSTWRASQQLARVADEVAERWQRVIDQLEPHA